MIASCTALPANTSPASLISSPTAQAVPTYTYKIVNVFPHDTQAFTQGLAFEDGFLYEGTGLYGASSLRRVDLTTGKVLQKYQLPPQYFGEGIALYRDSIVQLTWQSHIGFIYDKNSFELRSDFSYSTEGWGITTDGSRLIMSDGTSRLYFRDPVTLNASGDIEVKDGNTSLDRINELEYINGKVYANIWQTDRIAIIEPQTGYVAGWIDLSGLLQTQNFRRKADVLNGIAYDMQAERLFVTGKLWPYLFEIELAVR